MLIRFCCFVCCSFEFSIHLPATTSPSIPFSQYGQLHYKCKASVRGSGGLLKHKMSTERGVLVVCLPKQAEEDELPFRVDETHDQLWSGPQQISLWAEVRPPLAPSLIDSILIFHRRTLLPAAPGDRLFYPPRHPSPRSASQPHHLRSSRLRRSDGPVAHPRRGRAHHLLAQTHAREGGVF